MIVAKCCILANALPERIATPRKMASAQKNTGAISLKIAWK
jgi:hypothetical protein